MFPIFSEVHKMLTGCGIFPLLLLTGAYSGTKCCLDSLNISLIIEYLLMSCRFHYLQYFVLGYGKLILMTRSGHKNVANINENKGNSCT